MADLTLALLAAQADYRTASDRLRQAEQLLERIAANPENVAHETLLRRDLRAFLSGNAGVAGGEVKR